MRFTSHLLRDHQFWYQTQYLFPLLWIPFHALFQASNSKLPMIPPYFALNIFVSFNSRVTFATFIDVIDQIVDLAEVCSPGMPTLYPFVSTMEFLKKGRRLHHDDRSREMKTSMYWTSLFEKSKPGWEDPLDSLPNLPPYSPLKSWDEISCSGGELWRPDNQVTVKLC